MSKDVDKDETTAKIISDTIDNFCEAKQQSYYQNQVRTKQAYIKECTGI